MFKREFPAGIRSMKALAKNSYEDLLWWEWGQWCKKPQSNSDKILLINGDHLTLATRNYIFCEVACMEKVFVNRKRQSISLLRVLTFKKGYTSL